MAPAWMRSLLCTACAVSLLAAADGMTPVREILARETMDSWAANDLRQAITDLDPSARPAALALVAAARKPEFVPLARDLMAASDPAVVTAAIGVVEASWPTSSEDAQAVRSLITHRDASVSSAAVAFAATIHDDQAVPALADRLLADPDNSALHQALVNLTGHDAGDAHGWHDWHRQQEDHVLNLLGSLESRLIAEDPKEVMVAVSVLLGERGAPALIAEQLLTLVDHPDAQVRSLVRSALAVNPSVAAACWRSGEDAVEAIAFTDSGTEVGSDRAASAPATALVATANGEGANATAAETGGSSVGLWLLVLGGLAGGAVWWRRAHAVRATLPTAPPTATPVPGAPGTALPGAERKRRISVIWAK